MPDPAQGQGPHRGELSPEERAAFERRISELGSKLDKVSSQRASETSGRSDVRSGGRGMAYGFRMASELVGAVLVGSVIGYGLDWALGTKPWFFLLFFVLGFAAGVLNVVRGYTRMQKEIAAETKGNIGHAVPDDDD